MTANKSNRTYRQITFDEQPMFRKVTFYELVSCACILPDDHQKFATRDDNETNSNDENVDQQPHFVL